MSLHVDLVEALLQAPQSPRENAAKNEIVNLRKRIAELEAELAKSKRRSKVKADD